MTQSLAGVDGAVLTAQFGAPGSASALSFRRSVAAIGTRVTSAYGRGERVTAGARRLASVALSACANYSESAVVAVSSTEEQLYERDFYDAGCTQIKDDLFFDITATSTSSATGGGTMTRYDPNGQQSDYEVLGISLTGVGTGSGAFAILTTDAPNATAAVTAKVGIACGVGSTSLACTFAAVAHQTQAADDLGAAITIAASATTNASGGTTVPVSGSGSAYTGALNGLDVVAGASTPGFAISGGSRVDSASYTGSFAFTPGGTIQSGSFTLTDAADDGTATVTTTGAPATIVGTITRTSTGAKVASFSVDVAGNGTVTYGNGAVATVTNWVVYG